MCPLTAALVIANRDLRRGVQASLDDLSVRVVLERETIAEWPAFLERLTRLTPDLLLIDSPQFHDEIEGGAQRIKCLYPAPSVIVIHDSAESEAILRAIRAGADEFVCPPLETNLRAAIEHVARNLVADCPPDRQEGKIVGFLSSKGGCGATSIACHVAVELPRKTKQETLLVDCDVDLGIVGLLMKANTLNSVLDAAKTVERMEFGNWKELTWSAQPRLDVVRAPERPPRDEGVDPEIVEKLFRFVRSRYDWVIADLGRGLNFFVRSLLREFDELFLISTWDVLALYQTKQIVQTLRWSGYQDQHIHVVLNRTPKWCTFTRKDIQQALAVPVWSTLAERPELEEAFKAGTLVASETRPGKELAALTGRIADFRRAENQSTELHPAVRKPASAPVRPITLPVVRRAHPFWGT
jgi:pilus assembly protein CpaE